jgi:hypothetical protein
MALGIAEDIGKIRDFETLLKYLQKNLDWPIDLEEIEELTFEYQPEELGLDEECRVRIKEIKHLRPFSTNQPWGIFWIEFENRHLPVVVMRRILRALVPKKRAAARAADRAVWNLQDLLFISSLGEHGHRRITFSHFREQKYTEPTLETFSWDERETHFYYLERLHMDRLQWPADISDVDDWRRQWASAFTSGYREPIRTAKELSEKLASLAARTRDLVLEVLKYERSDGPLHRLFESFQKVLIHDLREDGFSDMVAQTVAYGLFSARCTGQEVLGLAHLEAMVPNTNRFLKELFAELASISGHKKGQINFDDLGISDMVELLKNTNIEAVLEDFGRQTGGGKEDPVVHFYETFLHVYDKEQKVQRGVFYTPKPVVSFIVRSVHEILQKEFGLRDGLADTTSWHEMAEVSPGLQIPAGVKPDTSFVQILDPATGTGTFLEEVIEVVHKTMSAKWRQLGKNAAQQHEAWNEYVPKQLLPRLHGFELMMAPYSVAHMKLGLKLRQTGYEFKSNQQLRVYLTNTLEPPEKGSRTLGFLPDFLSHESMQADLVKERTPITAVIGNPPYSGHSANKGAWSHDLLRIRLPDGADSYFNVDGAPLNERNPKWLNDDYVKFLRYGQFRISSAGVGVLGFITNHSYVDNPTFRGMRQSLMQSYCQALIIDLHGNTKKGEQPPAGVQDQNVFDIQQGVAIGLFVKCLPRTGEMSSIVVEHGDLWGTREEKYDTLLAGDVVSFPLEPIAPKSPFYLFVASDTSLELEYQAGWKVDVVFPIHSLGIVTARDSLTVHFTSRELMETVTDFASLPTEVAREKYSLGSDARDWTVRLAKQDVKSAGSDRKCVHTVRYRPFDTRWTYYTGTTRGFLCMPRSEVMGHMLGGHNIGIHICRQIVSERWQHVLATNALTDDCYVSNKSRERGYTMPLFLRVDNAQTEFGGRTACPANIAPEFIKEVEQKLHLSFTETPSGDLRRTFGPSDLLAYIYAILHAPTYRSRYFEFLHRDFPRIPVATDVKLFARLVGLGSDLVALHVLDDSYPAASWNRSGNRRNPLVDPGVQMEGSGANHVVERHPSYQNGHVYINPQRWFSPVPVAVWEFEIGAYQVCEKWLKDRRGRKLTEAEISTYCKIVASIRETARIMQVIDQTIAAEGGWPIS